MSLKVYLANINSAISSIDISNISLDTSPSIFIYETRLEASPSVEISWVEIDSEYTDIVTNLGERLPLFKGALFVGNTFDGYLYTAQPEVIKDIVNTYGKKIPSKVPRYLRTKAPHFRIR